MLTEKLHLKHPEEEDAQHGVPDNQISVIMNRAKLESKDSGNLTNHKKINPAP